MKKFKRLLAALVMSVTPICVIVTPDDADAATAKGCKPQDSAYRLVSAWGHTVKVRTDAPLVPTFPESTHYRLSTQAVYWYCPRLEGPGIAHPGLIKPAAFIDCVTKLDKADPLTVDGFSFNPLVIDNAGNKVNPPTVTIDWGGSGDVGDHRCKADSLGDDETRWFKATRVPKWALAYRVHLRFWSDIVGYYTLPSGGHLKDYDEFNDPKFVQ